MKTTFKYVFRFTEYNTRLGEKRCRTKTLNLPRELFEHYDVDGMLRAFRSEERKKERKFTFSDSTVVVKTIKVGRTEFQI